MIDEWKDRAAHRPLEKRERQAGEAVAWIVSSGPHDFPVLQWLSADHSFRAPIGSMLVAIPATKAERRVVCPTCNQPPISDCAFANCKREFASLPAPQAVQAIKTPEAFQALAAALAADPGYAWSWHCAVWASAHDEGMETGAANRAAARFMHMAFAIDTSKNANFNAEHLSAAPSPDGKAEQAEAPSARAVLEAVNKALDEQGVKGGLARRHLEDRVLYHLRATQPTASNAGERETQRAAFEREYEAYCQPAEADWFRREDDDPDEYYHVATKEAWWGWCTALATKPPAGEQKPVEGEDYYVSGPYVTGMHAGFHAVAELSTGRIVHFFKPDQAQPEQVAQDSRPTEPGLYAWVPKHGSPSLVLVGKRPTAHCDGGILNGKVLDSSKFYDGCAMTSWPADGWVNLDAARARGEGERS